MSAPNLVLLECGDASAFSSLKPSSALAAELRIVRGFAPARSPLALASLVHPITYRDPI